ncbi:MAG: hypothetical protein U9Q03_02095 [Patescibacteria group bacterium]|nr:hypothetical protein [Patescibacteria group bacterium]
MTDEIDRSAERLRFLIDEAHDTGTDCQAIDELGNFRVGAAVAALVDLLDHPEGLHRYAARGSLLRIRDSMGALWLDGSLTIIRHNAKTHGDRRTRLNALNAMVDCTPVKMFSDRLVEELVGSDEEDVIFAVGLAARVPNKYIATRLCWIVDLDDSRSEGMKMAAAESLAVAVRDMDTDSLGKLMRVVGGTTGRLLGRHETADGFDHLLSRFAKVHRSIAERLDDIANGIDS